MPVDQAPDAHETSSEETTSESMAGQVPPIPDEDGPHDVPDDKVIEKTLPTGPVNDPMSSP